jgi:hypothetical protein
MTTTEHLDRILAKCRANLSSAHNSRAFIMEGPTMEEPTMEERAAEAVWSTTIAAIEGLQCPNCGNTGEVEGANIRTGEPEQQQCQVCAYQDSRVIDAILADWPEELL